MEKFMEWVGGVGKVAVAIGAGIGAAIGVVALIWQNFMNKSKLKQNQMVQHQMPYYNTNIYGGGWAY